MKYLEDDNDVLLKKIQEPNNTPILTDMENNSFEKQIETILDFEKLTELCQHLEEALQEILNSCGLYFRIFSRVKTADSIAKKIQKGNYGTEENPKKIQDLLGLRVVLYYHDDLSICQDIMESTFQMIDDWSVAKYNVNEFKATKINGVFRIPEEYFKLYKRELWSLPIDTTFEIQFRTVFFEGWHEIEHDMRYKSELSDQEFWEGSEDLSRILNCILANLELSDWSLVQLFDRLSYNHYKKGNWELMLKSKFRIRLDESKNLHPGIIEIFDNNKDIAKAFFKRKRMDLIRELLKLDNPNVNYDLIIKLLNQRYIHNPEITQLFENLPDQKDARIYQKQSFARLESHLLFHLELPLLHKETRSLETEFQHAAGIIYRWARFKVNPVFEDIPAEVSTYKNSLPGYQITIKYNPEQFSFSMKLHYIDSQSIGTLWHEHASIELWDDGKLHFYHITSRDVPRGVSQKSTFSRPAYLSELSNKVGIVDVKRLGTKAVYIETPEMANDIFSFIEDSCRTLPIAIITQHEPSQISTDKWDYDINTFTINGTRLAKVIGLYAHVFMFSLEQTDVFASYVSITEEDAKGCIAIFWPTSTNKPMELYTREMVLHTQFDFNRFAFHDDKISEKAFRHKLVQIIKDDHVSH